MYVSLGCMQVYHAVLMEATRGHQTSWEAVVGCHVGAGNGTGPLQEPQTMLTNELFLQAQPNLFGF